jgi:hypothetical protein
MPSTRFLKNHFFGAHLELIWTAYFQGFAEYTISCFFSMIYSLENLTSQMDVRNVYSAPSTHSGSTVRHVYSAPSTHAYKSGHVYSAPSTHAYKSGHVYSAPSTHAYKSGLFPTKVASSPHVRIKTFINSHYTFFICYTKRIRHHNGSTSAPTLVPPLLIVVRGAHPL